MASPNKPNPIRTEIKEELYTILSTFPDRIFRTSEVFDLMTSNHDIRVVSSALYQISRNKSGKFRFIQNPARGRYVWSKTAYAERADIGAKKAQESKTLPVIEIVDQTPETATETVQQIDVEIRPGRPVDHRIDFSEVMPLVDPATATVRSSDDEMLLRRVDGTLWIARKVGAS